MQLDRAKFLALTTTIAAGHVACAREAQPAEQPAMLMATAAPLGRLGPTPPASEPPIATSPAITAPTATASARNNPFDVSSAVPNSAYAGIVCPVTTGTIGDCGTLRPPGPSCEGFDDLKETCSTLARSLQPRVAQKAVACILAKSGTRAMCDFRTPSRCVLGALAAACTDPAVETTCASIASNCGPGRVPLGGAPMITKPPCIQALSAVSGPQRDSVRSCVSEECSLNSCFLGLQ
jgi:hypothetical protein